MRRALRAIADKQFAVSYPETRAMLISVRQQNQPKLHCITVIGRSGQQHAYQPPVNTWVGDGAGIVAPHGPADAVQVRSSADAARAIAELYGVLKIVT